MGLAPVAYVLWTKHLRNNPADPAWMDRVVDSLGETVYISIDVDGLDPAMVTDVPAVLALIEQSFADARQAAAEAETSPVGRERAVQLAADHLNRLGR
mgnify:CR=1 FL=1